MNNDDEIFPAQELIYRTEYGSVEQVRFANASMVRLEDAKGNEILCSCGKPVTSTIMSKNAFLALCEECWGKKLMEEVDERLK